MPNDSRTREFTFPEPQGNYLDNRTITRLFDIPRKTICGSVYLNDLCCGWNFTHCDVDQDYYQPVCIGSIYKNSDPDGKSIGNCDIPYGVTELKFKIDNLTPLASAKFGFNFLSNGKCGSDTFQFDNSTNPYGTTLLNYRQYILDIFNDNYGFPARLDVNNYFIVLIPQDILPCNYNVTYCIDNLNTQTLTEPVTRCCPEQENPLDNDNGESPASSIPCDIPSGMSRIKFKINTLTDSAGYSGGPCSYTRNVSVVIFSFSNDLATQGLARFRLSCLPDNFWIERPNLSGTAQDYAAHIASVVATTFGYATSSSGSSVTIEIPFSILPYSGYPIRTDYVQFIPDLSTWVLHPLGAGLNIPIVSGPVTFACPPSQTNRAQFSLSFLPDCTTNFIFSNELNPGDKSLPDYMNYIVYVFKDTLKYDAHIEDDYIIAYIPQSVVGCNATVTPCIQNPSIISLSAVEVMCCDDDLSPVTESRNKPQSQKQIVQVPFCTPPCPNDVDCSETDLLYFQFLMPDNFNDWGKTLPTHGWKADKSDPWLCTVEVLSPMDYTAPNFDILAPYKFVGKLKTGQSIQQIVIDPSVLPPIFALHFTFNGNGIEYHSYTEPYERAICDKTLVLEGVYSDFGTGSLDCDGLFYGVVDYADQLPFKYRHRVRVRGSIMFDSFNIDKTEVISNITRSVTKSVTKETIHFKTRLVPPYVAEQIKKVLSSKIIKINGEEYSFAGEVSKNIEVGAMWSFDLKFERIVNCVTQFDCI